MVKWWAVAWGIYESCGGGVSIWTNVSLCQNKKEFVMQ